MGRSYNLKGWLLNEAYINGAEGLEGAAYYDGPARVMALAMVLECLIKFQISSGKLVHFEKQGTIYIYQGHAQGDALYYRSNLAYTIC